MKNYKAIVIDGKKCFRILRLLLILAAFLLLLRFFVHIGVFPTDSLWSPKTHLENVFPSAAAANNALEERLTALKTRFTEGLYRFLQCNPAIPTDIFAAEIPVVKQVQNSEIARLAGEKSTNVKAPQATASVPTPTPAPVSIPPENQAPIKAVDVSPSKGKAGGIALGNETSYSIDIDEMLTTPPSISMSGDAPKVLIIHTHATEAYSPEGSTVYDVTAGDRSQNPQENVVRIGKTLQEVFKKKGINAIHDTEFHDYPSFNGSYAHALSAIEGYLKQYPSIQIVLDIHRDSIVYSDNTKAKPVTQINGRNAAQLMFVVGTDEKGLHHPNWRDNLKAAIHFQNAIIKKYPSLMRHINLRQERFNGHTTKASMIIETGASGNTLSEAEYGITLAAECIADFLNSLR